MADWIKQWSATVGAVFLLSTLALTASCGDYLEEVGASCSQHAHCDERCVGGSNFPGGMCTVTCDDDYDCPVDTYCIDRKDGICLPACDRHHDCRREYVCSDERSHGHSGRMAVCIGD